MPTSPASPGAPERAAQDPESIKREFESSLSKIKAQKNLKEQKKVPAAAEPEPGDDDPDGGDGDPRAPCQVIWCDQRAFKSDSNSLRAELDGATQVQAKAHKTAEKCIRLLQKKRRAREKVEARGQARPLSVFLVSWANAKD